MLLLNDSFSERLKIPGNVEQSPFRSSLRRKRKSRTLAAAGSSFRSLAVPAHPSRGRVEFQTGWSQAGLSENDVQQNFDTHILQCILQCTYIIIYICVLCYDIPYMLYNIYICKWICRLRGCPLNSAQLLTLHGKIISKLGIKTISPCLSMAGEKAR